MPVAMTNTGARPKSTWSQRAIAVAVGLLLLVVLGTLVAAWTVPSLALIRVPLFAGLLLMAFPLIALTVGARLLANVFVISAPLRLAAVYPTAYLTGLAIAMMVAALLGSDPVQNMGMEAYDASFWIYLQRIVDSSWVHLVAFVLALPVIGTVTFQSIRRARTIQMEVEEEQSEEAVSAWQSVLDAVSGSSAGTLPDSVAKGVTGGVLATALLSIGGAAVYDDSLAGGESAVELVAPVLASATDSFFLPPGGWEVHAPMLGFLLFFGTAYTVSGFYFRPRPGPHPEAATLFYVLMLFSIIVLVAGFADFYAHLNFSDFVLPLVTVLVVVSLAMTVMIGGSHFYRLSYVGAKASRTDEGRTDEANDEADDEADDEKPKPEDTGRDAVTATGAEAETPSSGRKQASADPDDEVPDVVRALERRLDRQDGDRVLTVACLKGGGIQASSWSARVLGGLQEAIGPRFTKSLGLISSVSGGSVGSMFYLHRFNDAGILDPGDVDRAFLDASADSLDAVGWGLSYLDVWRPLSVTRIIADTFGTPRLRDRGDAIERSWNNPLGASTPPTLLDWRRRVLGGKLPIPVFNATIVNGGQRYLLSPLKIAPSVFDPDENAPIERRVVSFGDTFDGYDMNVSTAARLSSTFPYVAPISRNDLGPGSKYRPYYAADGGYFDNFGIFTAAEILRHVLLEHNDTLRIDRVVVLLVDGFPRERYAAPQEPTTWRERLDAWSMSVSGPINTVLAARQSTQRAHGDLELDLLARALQSPNVGVDLDVVPVDFPALNDPDADTYVPPLSWKLTPTQIHRVDLGWQRLLRDGIANDPAFDGL